MKSNIKNHPLLCFFLIMLVSCSGEQQGQSQQPVNEISMRESNESQVQMNMPMPMEGMQNMSGMGGAGTEEMLPVDDLGQVYNTENGRFQVLIEPGLDPLPLNQIHGWVLTLQDESGLPLDNAQITVEGGMPVHNHGMPTSPQVTENLGNGRYQVEGVQFQMPGHWVVKFNITVGDQTDSITYNLMLQP